MTLYVFDNDAPGESTCNGGCASAWPPLIVPEDQPLLAQEDISVDVTMVKRSDDTWQVAYKGRPLYFYSGDTAPGDTTGDGSGGVWHTATP
jgi:predicted lipoprotein with Yx(FWY)xxD motif